MLVVPIAITAWIFSVKNQSDKEVKDQKYIIETTTDPAILMSAIMTNKKTIPKITITNDRMGVAYSLDEMGKAEAMRTLYNIYVRQFVIVAFDRWPKINRIETVGTVSLIDARGNERVDTGIKSVFTRKNAASIKWENVPYNNVPNIADEYWVHPVLLKAD